MTRNIYKYKISYEKCWVKAAKHVIVIVIVPNQVTKQLPIYLLTFSLTFGAWHVLLTTETSKNIN